MTAYVVAVDGGSQSAKVSIVDAAGVVHASAAVALRPYALTPEGHAVHPDDDLWTTLVEACRRALATFAGDPAEIVAVGLCGIRYCRALVAADGSLVEPVASWMDVRVSRPLADVDPRVATVCSAGGYLAIRLTGERRDSAANYQGRWPVDRLTRQWSTDAAEVARTGMPLALLPDLVDPGERLGRVTPVAAEETGLREGLPVFATANDKAVEALGCGLLDDETVLLSLGTYIAAMTPGADPGLDDARAWVNDACVPGRYLYESGGVRRGMWTVSWLRSLVSAAAPDLVDPHAVTAWLNQGAAEVPPGCGGLVTVPDWLAPDDAPYRRGVMLGFDGSHGPAHLYRSILEGIALTMRGHVDDLLAALDRPLGRLVVSGGGARSAPMMQIVADVFDAPAEQAAEADAAGLGAAICAAVGAGLHSDFDSAVAAMVRPGVRFEPAPDAVAAYAALRPVYADLHAATDPVLARLAALRPTHRAFLTPTGRCNAPPVTESPLKR